MFFCLSLPLFCKTTIPFYATKTSNFLVTHHFYGRIFVCAYQRFCLPCSCSLLFFHCRSFSSCWRSHFSFSHSLAAMKCSCFSSKESKFVSFVSFVSVPVVRTDGRTYGHVTTKISRMHRLPNFLTHGSPLRASHAL